MLVRTDKAVDGRYSIGRLLSPRDEGIDLDESSWGAALDLSRKSFKPDPGRGRINPPETPSGPAIRFTRGFGAPDTGVTATKQGLLLLYLLDPVESKAPKNRQFISNSGLRTELPWQQGGHKGRVQSK